MRKRRLRMTFTGRVLVFLAIFVPPLVLLSPDFIISTCSSIHIASRGIAIALLVALFFGANFLLEHALRIVAERVESRPPRWLFADLDEEAAREQARFAKTTENNPTLR